MAKLNKNEGNLNPKKKRLRLKAFSKTDIFNKWVQKNTYNRLANVPTPPKELQNSKCFQQTSAN